MKRVNTSQQIPGHKEGNPSGDGSSATRRHQSPYLDRKKAAMLSSGERAFLTAEAHNFEGSPLGVAALWSPVCHQGGPAHDGPLHSPWLRDSLALASEATVPSPHLPRDKRALIGRVRTGPHLGVISPWH